MVREPERPARLKSSSPSEPPIPDCGFCLETAAGPTECYLEWDRGTETLERLSDKLKRYWHAEVHFSPKRGVVNVLFVVPTERRLQALVDAVYADAERRREKRDNWFIPSWPLWATLASELAAQGPLGRSWRSLREPNQHARLSEMAPRTQLAPIEYARCLGRRWRKDQPDFWQALSPLGVAAHPRPVVESAESHTPATAAPTAAPSAIERMRGQLLAEARRDAESATTPATATADWTSSGINGLMLDPDEEPAPEEWR